MTSTLVGQLVTLQIIFEDCRNETRSEKAFKDTITPHGEVGCCGWCIYVWYCRSWQWKIPKFHWPSSRTQTEMQRSFAADDCLYSFKKGYPETWIVWNQKP